MTYNPLANFPSSAMSNARKGVNVNSNALSRGTPVRIVSAGGIDKVDPSIESQIDSIIGVVKHDVLPGNQVDIITSGTVEDITTTAAIGQPIYLSKTGGLTDIKPSIGVNGFVAGDWIIKIGVIAKNNTNPAQKDLIVNLQILGQL